MNPAAKLEIIMDLHNSGFLCKCEKYQEFHDLELNTFRRDLVHEENCDGLNKIKELLEFGDTNG